MPRLVLKAINFAEGASIEALDDWLAWLRDQRRGVQTGLSDFYSTDKRIRLDIARTYLDLRKARAINRHSQFPLMYAKSGIPCRRPQT